MATLTVTPTTLQRLEHLEERCVQLEDELDKVTGKSWEIRHGVYTQVLREIKKLEKQLTRESVTDLLPA